MNESIPEVVEMTNTECMLWELVNEVRNDWNSYGIKLKLGQRILELMEDRDGL